MEKCTFNFTKTCLLFQVAAPFLLAVCEFFVALAGLADFCCSKCVWGSLCGFNLHFPSNAKCLCSIAVGIFSMKCLFRSSTCFLLSLFSVIECVTLLQILSECFIQELVCSDFAQSVACTLIILSMIFEEQWLKF